MRTTITAFCAALALTAASAWADQPEPVELTADQMDEVTAAGPAYGKTIQAATGTSFGGLVGPAKSTGTATHGNYAGGAKALVEAVCDHIVCS
jgi:hypothetical protein